MAREPNPRFALYVFVYRSCELDVHNARTQGFDPAWRKGQADLALLVVKHTLASRPVIDMCCLAVVCAFIAPLSIPVSSPRPMFWSTVSARRRVCAQSNFDHNFLVRDLVMKPDRQLAL